MSEIEQSTHDLVGQGVIPLLIRLRVNKKLSYKIYLRLFWLPTIKRKKGKQRKGTRPHNIIKSGLWNLYEN